MSYTSCTGLKVLKACPGCLLFADCLGENQGASRSDCHRGCHWGSSFLTKLSVERIQGIDKPRGKNIIHLYFAWPKCSISFCYGQRQQASGTNRIWDFITSEIIDVPHHSTVTATILKCNLSSVLLWVKEAVRLSVKSVFLKKPIYWLYTIKNSLITVFQYNCFLVNPANFYVFMNIPRRGSLVS